MYGDPALPIWGEYTREALFSPSELTKLIADGEVRFLLIDSRRNSKLLGELGTWIRHNCSDVTRLAVEKRGRNLFMIAMVLHSKNPDGYSFYPFDSRIIRSLT